QDRDDVLAISAPIIGAAAPCIGDPATVQSNGNLIGRKFVAFHLGRQSIATPNEIGNGPVVKVASAARKGFGRRERANCFFPDRSLDHVWTFRITIASMRVGTSRASPSPLWLRIRHEQLPKQLLALVQASAAQSNDFQTRWPLPTQQRNASTQSSSAVDAMSAPLERAITRSCPLGWCKSGGGIALSGGFGRICQAATAG